jgi:hypothetical protein
LVGSVLLECFHPDRRLSLCPRVTFSNLPPWRGARVHACRVDSRVDMSLALTIFRRFRRPVSSRFLSRRGGRPGGRKSPVLLGALRPVTSLRRGFLQYCPSHRFHASLPAATARMKMVQMSKRSSNRCELRGPGFVLYFRAAFPASTSWVRFVIFERVLPTGPSWVRFVISRTGSRPWVRFVNLWSLIPFDPDWVGCEQLLCAAPPGSQ